MRRHGDMVLLIGAGRRRVGDAGVGQVLVLAHQGGAGDLGDHKAGIEAGIGGQEGRQVEAQRRVHHKRHAALGDGADFGNGQGDHIGGEADRLGMKVSARGDFAPFDQNQRVVGHGVGFDGQCGGRHTQNIQGGAEHLGLAANAVGVLHAAVAVAVTLADFRSAHHRRHPIGHVDLPAMAAQPMDLGVQRRGRSHNGVGGQGRGEQRGLGEAARVEQRGEGVGARELRAVDQGEALFRAQRKRGNPGAAQRLFAGQSLAPVKGLALADQHGGHVREGRQIAGGADRSLGRYPGNDLALEQGVQGIDHGPANARSAAPEGEQLQRDHQPRFGAGQGRADAAAMAQDQLALQRPRILGVNLAAGQFAKAGVDAVNGRLAHGRPTHQRRSRLDSRPGRRVEDQRSALPIDRLQRIEGGGAGLERDHAAPPKIRRCSGLNPIR